MSTRDVIDLLRAANPVPTVLLDERAEQLRRQILQMPRGTRRAVPRRLLLAGATGALAVAGTAVAIWPSSTAAYALTPQLLDLLPDGASAPDILNGLADRAQRQPAPMPGRYFYIRTQDFSLDVAVTSGSGVSSVHITQEERWLAADGSGRSISVEGRAEVAPSDRDPSGKASFEPQPQSDQRYGPGEFSEVVDLSLLSTDPAVLADQLARNQTQFAWSNNAPQTVSLPDWYRRLMVLVAIAKQQAVPPQLWASMLRVLATTPGLVSQGTVSDRAGRPAVVISVDTTDSRPARVLILLDPDTGAFVGEERILTTKYGDGPFDAYLNVRIPAVIGYVAVLAAGPVAADTDRIGARQ